VGEKGKIPGGQLFSKKVLIGESSVPRKSGSPMGKKEIKGEEVS